MQAELAAVSALDLPEDEAAMLRNKLNMHDFMGELVDRVYRPGNYDWVSGWPDFMGADDWLQSDFHRWVQSECDSLVIGVVVDYAFSEEAYRVRSSLNKWHSLLWVDGNDASSSSLTVWLSAYLYGDWDPYYDATREVQDSFWLLDQYLETYRKLYTTIREGWPHPPATPSDKVKAIQAKPKGRAMPPENVSGR